MLTIVADMRERRSGICHALEKMENVSLSYADLEAGDYILGEGVGLERKEAGDFINSLIHDKRLFEQIRLMKSSFERPLLLLEGNIFTTRSTIHPNALIGALSYITALEGIPVIPVPSAKHTAQMLHTIARHVQDGLGYQVPLRGNKPKDMDLAGQYLVEGLPAVGPSVAMKLLAHFGSRVR